MAGRSLASLGMLLLLLLQGITESHAGEFFCSQIDHPICSRYEEYNLTRVDGKQVNYTWRVRTDDGRSLLVKTINLHPQILEVEDFLSQEECDHVIKVAKLEGMQTSQTAIRDLRHDERYRIIDEDEDGFLTPQEAAKSMYNLFDCTLDTEDMREIYEELSVPTDEKGAVSVEDFVNVPIDKMEAVVEGFLTRHPERLVRFSEQAWVHPFFGEDAVLDRLKQRLSALTDMPTRLFSLGTMQVVRYGVGGHYFAHYDSSATSDYSRPEKCCDLLHNDSTCNTCRFLTLLLYLNDVTEGGETAFPFANGQWSGEESVSSTLKLSKNCSSASLVVRPKRGKALLWYNYFTDHGTKGLGQLDLLTYHGGCPVLQGEKWLASFWVNVMELRKDNANDVKDDLRLSSGKVEPKTKEALTPRSRGALKWEKMTENVEAMKKLQKSIVGVTSAQRSRDSAGSRDEL